MQTTKVLFRLVLVFLIFSTKVSVAQQGSSCLAVITSITGDVQVKQTGRSEFVRASWGTQLFQGDQVKTSARSGASLLFANSSLVTLEENSAMTVSGRTTSATESGTNIKKVSSASILDLSALTSKRDTRKDEGILAGLRSADAEKIIELTSPCNTLIKTSCPGFSWVPRKEFDNYVVNLYNSRGLVWSRKVNGRSLAYPENEKELEFGETYFWNVEGEDLVNTHKSPNQRFSVLSSEKSREIEEQESVIRNSFGSEPESSSLHSVLGAFYINQGLLQDAIREFQIIAEINADAPLPHEILGSLYSEVGNKDKAIEELQKALRLAKNKNE
ncbi:MAG: hypothetical protein K0B05_11935 [Bacteroidales bacterium]|nr:hypothetical protein [Bacteroidales bacterium]